MIAERLQRALREAIEKGDHVAEVYLRQRIAREHARHGATPNRDCPVCRQPVAR